MVEIQKFCKFVCGSPLRQGIPCPIPDIGSSAFVCPASSMRRTDGFHRPEWRRADRLIRLHEVFNTIEYILDTGFQQQVILFCVLQRRSINISILCVEAWLCADGERTSCHRKRNGGTLPRPTKVAVGSRLLKTLVVGAKRLNFRPSSQKSHEAFDRIRNWDTKSFHGFITGLSERAYGQRISSSER